MTESIRITKLKATHSYRFYMSSLTDTNAQTYYKFSIDHWSIENYSGGVPLHWQLYRTFKEDDSRIRKDNTPLNMNIVRKLALYLLSKNTEKSSIKRKRKKTARDNDFIISILRNSQIWCGSPIEYVNFVKYSSKGVTFFERLIIKFEHVQIGSKIHKQLKILRRWNKIQM